MFEIIWNLFASIFKCFCLPQINDTNKLLNALDTDEREYGKLNDYELTNIPSNINVKKITIKIPKYEFILLDE